MTRHILHVDMNAFYASVECQRRPELRQKPVAVCGDPEARHGIVLTANYVAKPKGVKTGMAIWQAKQVCPDLVVLPADMGEYIRISHMAREIYERYTDQIEPFGLDESWLDVTGSTELFGSAMDIAQEISDRIKFELGITASIGVSDNKITAKLGSDYQKPDAITRIERDNYKDIVYPLPVGDLLYVGPATERKLAVATCSSAEIAEAAFDLFRRSYPWTQPVRSIGVRGAGLVDGSVGIQTSLFDNDKRRSAWERIDVTVDELRRRYGYMSVRRAITMADPLLGGINPKDDHTVHPIGYFVG